MALTKARWDEFDEKDMRERDDAQSSGAMCGTTPPCEMITDPRSLFSLLYSARRSCQQTSNTDRPITEDRHSLFVVLDGELEMARDDTGLLVVARSVAGQLEDLSCQVFEHGCEVDGST